MNNNKSQAALRIIALGISLAILLAGLISVAPQLHRWLHGAANHECVATIIAGGSCDHAPTAYAIVIPNSECTAVLLPAELQFDAAALEFSRLEHAPPALS